jgi:hypothetical protein
MIEETRFLACRIGRATCLSATLWYNTVRPRVFSSLPFSFNGFLFYTDTHYTQPLEPWNRSSRCTTSEWCITTEHSETKSLFISAFLIHLFLILHRHSLHSTWDTITSEFKVHNIWVMDYDKTQWDLESCHLCLSQPTVSYFTQTLTTLDLTGNAIGDIGAQHLSDALRQNTVRLRVFSSLPFSSNGFLFYTDTHYTQPLQQSNRSSRCTTSEWCITTEHSETKSLFISPFLIQRFLILHRHSLHSTSQAMQSEIKVHNIWVMHYDRTQWDSESFHLFLCHPTVSYFTQTLTTLDLYNNNIGVQGAQHLSDGLRQNTVRPRVFSSLPLSSNGFLFYTDTHYTQPLQQSNRR